MNLFSNVAYEQIKQPAEKFKPNVSFTNATGEFFKEGFRTGITSKIHRGIDLFYSRGENEKLLSDYNDGIIEIGGDLLSPEEADKYFPIKEKRTQPIYSKLAKLEHGIYMDEGMASEFASAALEKNSNYLAMVIGGLGGTMLDPIESGASIFTGGLATESRIGMKMFESLGKAGRTVARGAAFGGAEAVVLDPFYHMISSYNNEQYTYKDTLTNLAFGTVMGTGAAGIMAGLGRYDTPIELSPDTIRRVFDNNLAALASGENISLHNIMAADMNVIRNDNVYGPAIETLYESKLKEFVGEPTEFQKRQVRAEAEREVFIAAQNGSASVPSRKQPVEVTGEEKIPEVTPEQSANEPIQIESDLDEELKSLGVEVDEELATPKTEPKKQKETTKKVEEPKDEEQLKLEKEENIDIAFKETANQFFPDTDVVNIKRATQLPPEIQAKIADGDFQAFYNLTDNRVYFNPEQINSENVGRVMLHEVVTHKGLRGIMNANEFDEFITYIDKNFKDDIENTRSQIEGGDKWDWKLAAEETLAYHSEGGIDAPEYFSYLWERTRNILGRDAKGKLKDNAIVKEALYQSLKESAKLRIEQRIAALGEMSDWNKEEIFHSIKKQIELRRKLENYEKIKAANEKYAAEIEVERQYTDAKIRGLKSRAKTDAKIKQLLEDQRAKEIELSRKRTDARVKAYKLEQEKIRKEIEARRDITDAKAKGMLKGLEDRLKLMPKWEAKIKDFFSDDYEYRGLSELQKLNKDLGIEESVSKYLAEHKAEQIELSKRIKEAEEAQEILSRSAYSQRTYEDLKKSLKRQEIESANLKKQLEAQKEIEKRAIAQAKNKEFKRNKKSIVNDNDIMEAYEDLEEMGIDLRFRKITKQEAADAKLFVSNISQVDNTAKNNKILKKLSKEKSPAELAHIDSMEPFLQDIYTAARMSGVAKEEALKAAKRMVSKSNVKARVSLFKEVKALPTGRQIPYLMDLVERHINATAYARANNYVQSFHSRASAITKDYNSKEVWEHVFIAGHNKYLASKNLPITQQANPIGQQIYDILKDVYGVALKDFRSVGGFHGLLEEYIQPQSWDIDKMAKHFGVSVESWHTKLFRTEPNHARKDFIIHQMYQFLENKIDWTRTRDRNGPIGNSVDRKQRYVKDWIEGLWDKKKSDWDSGGKSELPGLSIGDKSRNIFFKSGKDAFEAQRLFGIEDTMTAITENLKKIATDTTLIERLGHSYGNNVDAVIKEISNSTEQGSRRFQRNVRSAMEKLPISLRLIDGSNRTSDVVTMVKWLQIARTASVVAKMGNLLFTSQSDVAFLRSHLKKFNLDGEKLHDTAKIYSRIKTAEDKFILEQNLAFLDGWQGSLVSRYDPDTIAMSSLMAKVQHGLFTVNGMNWHNRTFREGFQLGAVRRMGIASQYSLADLKAMGDGSKGLVQLLESHGFTNAEWDALRSVASKVEINNGRHQYVRSRGKDSVLSLDLVKEIDDQEIKNLLSQRGINNPSATKIEAERNKLWAKYAGFIKDEMDTGILTPGVREWRQLNFGTREGSWQNTALKLLTQFKSFPLAMFNRVIVPTMKNNSPLMGLAKLSVVTAQAAAVSVMFQQLKSVLDGTTVRPWDDPMLWMDGISKAGGYSFMWDVATKDYTEYGMNSGVLANFGGPTIGAMNDGAALGQQLLKDMASGDFSKSGNRFAKFIDSWGGNMVVYDQLKKMLVVYPLMEHFNPDGLKRKQGFIEREFGKEYWYAAPTGENTARKTFSDLLLRVQKDIDNQ